ncbi:fat-like cadherin-related tumor suppressor homolog [Trichonephila clavata]|uniref:Fat-like cadherin-related tumor suppressor homolog n=2 Tax=Trichonephila clavata TaxID=2740835 RepID=A0A8X6KJV0_TRICU|nr:fat-like cadherin-related tumor suppressor homolog [Trichonephila clavata]
MTTSFSICLISCILIPGNIYTSEVLDRETSNRYWLTVHAVDRGAVPLSGRLDVYIEVLDDNDNVPLTIQPAYYPSIPENAPPGTIVLQLEAFDWDLNDDNKIRYSIASGDPQGFFSIDNVTGLITTATLRRLDREVQPEHALEIKVEDGGNPSLSSLTRVLVSIIDENDNDPEFHLTPYLCPILEISTADPSLVLCQVVASDADTGPSGDVTYSFEPEKGSDLFTINPKTGAIYAKQKLLAGESYDFNVQATDKGIPSRSSSVRVKVDVSSRPPASSRPPVCKEIENLAAVPENDPVYQAVAFLQAEDPDGDKVWYSIVGGNTDDAFMIQTHSGIVHVARHLDWEKKSNYNLNISITDGINIIYQQLPIKVINVNDHNPVFAKELYVADISENTPVGSSILQLEASDVDEIDKNLIYSIYNSANPQSLKVFKIDTFSGKLSISHSLDHESIKKHMLTVMVRDNGTPSRRSFARIVINVHDENDHHPEFSAASFKCQVYETAAVGSSVIRVLAIDKDKGQNSQLKFSIASGNIGNAFSIDETLGIVLIAKPLNRQVMPEYFLLLRASDKGTPSLNSTVNVHIIVTVANNAPPKFEQKDYIVEVHENEKPGKPLTAVIATSRSSVYYEIIDGNINDSFVINPTSGILRTNNILDFEVMKFYNLTIRATNMVGANSTTSVLVHVIDKNDNAPIFHQLEYRGQVIESDKIRSMVLVDGIKPLVVSAYDNDSEINSVLHYKIVEKSASAYFSIDPNTGAIRTATTFDHEKKSSFSFSVQAWDMGKPHLNAEVPAKVLISVIDINDCPPQFGEAYYTAILLLPTYKGVHVINVIATDLDSFGSIRYSITSGNIEKKFLINDTTGDITVLDPNGLARKYTLVITASDGMFETSTKVVIKVQESQQSGLQFSEDKYFSKIQENSTEISTVAIITPLGTELNEHLTFHILNPTYMFKIGETTGVIRTTGRMFDREAQSFYTLVVEVRNEGREISKYAHVLVEVSVVDINDNAPFFIGLPYFVVVPIDSSIDYSVFKVKAMDYDSGPNGDVVFEIIEGDKRTFRIDRKTGEIFLKQTLSSNKYELVIEARDRGNPALSSHTVLPIQVISHDMPVFAQQLYQVTVLESIPRGSPLLTVTATSPSGKQLIYSLVSGNRKEDLRLDFNTEQRHSLEPCVFYAVEDLDFETTPKYLLTLRATDAVSGVYADVQVVIDVEDVNDNPPMFNQPSYNTTVSEAMPSGASVLQVRATDRDTRATQHIQYHIVSNATSHFRVDPSDGTIYIKQPLDHELKREHYFTVMATDGGHPLLSSTAHVWIGVADMNDNPPEFDQRHYKCTVNQEVQRGQFIAMVMASDPDESDQSKLTYSIIDGNELQSFSINRHTGIITMSNLHQFNFEKSYILNVSVTDGVHSSYASVYVNIQGANNHSPHFSHNVYPVALPENTPAGKLITTIVATDEDIGNYGQFTYTIETKEYRKLFKIDSETGEVFTKAPIDREENELFQMVVSAIDAGGRCGYATVRVTITDENDNMPQFSVAEYTVTIPVNMTVGTTILKIHATDADESISATIDYSLYKSNNSFISELFGVTHDTGEVYIRKSATGHENYGYQFFILAKDHGVPSLETVVPVNAIFIDPKEDYPKFEHFEYIFFISESSPIGTIISFVNASCSRPVTYSFTPAPKGSKAELYLSKFSIDKHGSLMLLSEVDREVQSVYNLNVRASTVDLPTRVSCVDVTIIVVDTNDNDPVFDSDVYSVSVAENIEPGATILKVVATDADTSNDGFLSYHFGPDADNVVNIFQLDPISGWISTMISLDREDTAFYNFTVVAFDQGEPRRMATTWINVKLRDYNDNPPVFRSQHYNGDAYEDAPVGTVVVTLMIEDKDEEKSNIDFYIIEGDLQGQFHVVSPGQLSIKKPLDREVMASYQLTVLATDGKFTSKTWVSIKVSDVNDNPPMCLKTKYTEMVSENIPLDTYILIVEATDLDSYDNSRLYFYLSGDDHQDFSIDPITGQLKTAQMIDREKRSRYVLEAHVQDKGKPEWECTSTVEVLLSDVNDNAPQFAQELYSVNIPEDSEVGTLITKVHATDKDIGNNRMVSYYLEDSAQSHFRMDETTGIVSLNKPVDREEVPMYNLTVKASDHGSPRLSTLCTLLVLLQDVNDNPPEFTSKYYHASVSETAAVGTEILKLTATSRDSGVNAEIAYSIMQSPKSEVFSIHPKFGVLTISSPLDYETAHGYYILVKAVDGGTPPLSTEVGVNITITDANDNAPTFTQQSYNAIIREDALVGDKIMQVIATDIDSPPNARIKYSICGGDRFGQFLMDKSMGYVSLASELDREKVSNYVLEICATDSGIPTLSSTSFLNIEVSDVNDNPPLFSEENYTAIVQLDKLDKSRKREGKPLGFTVLKFTVTDQDAPPNTGPFLFDILSGNEDGAFRVVQQDATLRTASKFDVKNQSEFTLQVRVTDGGSPPLYSETWVNIIVIEESRYPPVVTPLDVSVSSYLDEFPGGVMGRVHAVDQDPYDKLIFDILSPHQNLFTIDREDGTIVALPGLDVGSYELNVSITDGKFTTYTTVSIEVNMVTGEAVANSVVIRLDDVTPEDFLLTYKKGFLRGLRNILNVRIKDVEIISLQPALQEKKRRQRTTQQDLDIVFAVHASGNKFHPPNTVRAKVKEKTDILEASVGLKVVKIMEDRCTEDRCVNGKCIDLIILDKAFAISITTDAMSYVCPQHYRKLECACEPGFGGPQCELAVNECSRRPCPSYRVCHPEVTVLGYICRCPEGKTGSLCDRDKNAMCKGPDCYEEKTPVSFQGKSYMSYVLNKPVDHHMSLVMQFRTKQATGNLLYAAGVRDYFILEVMNGLIQYRFDCGSGEGKLRIEQVKVNDGNWHKVRVERRGKSAEMILNKRVRASGKSHGPHEVLNLDGSDIYFGAEVRTNLETLSFEDIRMGFIGCMDDIQIDGISLPLHVNGNTAVATLNRFKKMELHCGVLLDLGICSSQPCLNGGTCVPTNSGFTCQCLSRYQGSHCEIDLDPCASNPCLNGGMCHNVDHKFICTCSSGITGPRCEFGRYCKPSPCNNGGICEEGTSGPVCKCQGYYGELCQYDIDECQTVPCASGACINLQGSFKCHCPPNMTGSLCNEHLFTTSITSSSWNTTVEEIIGISLVVLFILLLAMVIVCCWRYRHKRQQLRPNNEVLDAATNEYLLKNSVFEKDNLNRKISNLEVTSFTTPPLPPRPASYTPSTQDSVNALNNFDTVRSYGSAADDLENFPRQSNDYVQNISKPAMSCAIPALVPPPPSSSDNDSVLKGNWEKDHLKSKSKLYESKVPKDLQMRKVGDVPGLNTIPAPVVPSRGPSSLGVPSVLSLNSVDDMPGYIWDCSDWAVASQKPLSNIVEVSTKEVRDSSSIPSTESNSRASQIELLPKNGDGHNTKASSNHSGSLDFDRPDSEYVGDSENNDTDFGDSVPPAPNFENLLGMTDLEFADDGTDSLPASPHKYQRHPNSYLPTHTTSTANTSPDHTWNNNQRQICDLSDDEVMTYGFPPQGGRGFHVPVDASGLDSMSMSIGGYTSTNASFSDISGAVCEIDDSEANCSDVDYEGVEVKPPAVFSNDRFCSTHL